MYNREFALCGVLILSLLLAACETHLRLERVGGYAPHGPCGNTEIVSIQASSQQLALSCSEEGIVDILSIDDPAHPAFLNRLRISAQEIVSSVAFHPTKPLVAAAVIHREPFATGSIQLRDTRSSKILDTLQSGVHPDGLAFSPNGRYLVVANEGEAYRYRAGRYESPPGSITLVHFDDEGTVVRTDQISLEDYSDIEGMLNAQHARSFGRIIIGANHNDFTNVPIKKNTPAHTEPEYVTFSPDSSTAYISLQENNGVVVLDTATASIKQLFGLGTTTHLADTRDDGKVEFNQEITALREPDGLDISPDGKLLLTADEGDTTPKASNTPDGKVLGGGRTLSVFDARSGKLIADTGNQLDKMAHAAGLYPDSRSDDKGSEPETVVSFIIDGVVHAAVALERAHAVALVSLKNPARPRVLHVEEVDPGVRRQGQYAPEGLAYYASGGRHFLFTANEKSGTMTVMEVLK